MERREITCIGCPLGCLITVEMKEDEVVSITGYSCKCGEMYACKEVTNPTRVVTSTVQVKNGSKAQVSVKTAKDIPKKLIFDCMKQINQVIIEAPVAIGNIVIEDVCGTGVDVIATKNVNVSE